MHGRNLDGQGSMTTTGEKEYCGSLQDLIRMRGSREEQKQLANPSAPICYSSEMP